MELQWSVHSELQHTRMRGGEILRISFLSSPYGTTAYARLQILTRQGWRTLEEIQFIRGGNNLMTEEEAVQQLQQKAEQLDVSAVLPAVELPAAVILESLQWQTVEELEHCVILGQGIVRIEYRYFHYSYGTTAYVSLRLLTKKGWKVLYNIRFMEGGKELQPIAEAEAQLKQYTEFLYCGVGTVPAPASVALQEISWSQAKGGYEKCVVCGDTTVRIEWNSYPYSYGTTSYVTATFIPKCRDDREEAAVHTVQWQFNEGEPEFGVHGTHETASEAAEARVKQYVGWLFANPDLIR